MFTGIVAAVGRIESVIAGSAATRLMVSTATLALDDVAIGDSIAVNGCCLTVVGIEPDPPRLAFDVSAVTLACTAGLDTVGPVNLEKALRLSDRLGGHLMTGHVDGVATIVSNERVEVVGPLGVARLPPEARRETSGEGPRALSARGSTPGESPHRPTREPVVGPVAPRRPERAPWERPGGAHGSRRLVADAPADLARFIARKGSIALAGVSLTVNAVAGNRFEANLIPHTLDATTLGDLRSGSRVNVEIDLVARYVARLGDSE